MKFHFKNHTEHSLEVRGVLGADATPEQLAALNEVELVIYIRDALPADALQAVERDEDPDPTWAEREPSSERIEWAEDGD